MQLEWSRFIEGMTVFKERQGMLWILCVFFFVILWYRKHFAKDVLFISSAVLGVCVACPITAVILLKGFTPFYDWTDLQQIFPVVLLTAILATELFFFFKKLHIPGLSLGKYGKAIISGIAIVVMLLVSTGFHSFDEKAAVQEDGIPVRTASVFAGLHAVIGEAEIILAAPNDMLQYTRLFDADWHPIYGRDLYSAKSASYINSGYKKEYRYYDILSKDTLSAEKAEEFTALINDEDADCIIIPDFWLEYIGETPSYEKVNVTDVYIGIIKKELISK